MRMHEMSFEAGRPVDGYGPGYFRIGGETHEGPLAILPGGVADWSGWPDTAPFTARAGEIDVLLVGTGAEIGRLDPAVRRRLEEAGLGLETMASGPACRTYNVLLSEGRRVALAALPV